MKEAYALMTEDTFKAIAEVTKERWPYDSKECEKMTIAFWHMVDGKWVHCAQDLDRKSKVVTFWSRGKEEGTAKMEGCRYLDSKKNS